jgi:hypothetical protein
MVQAHMSCCRFCAIDCRISSVFVGSGDWLREAVLTKIKRSFY